MNRAVGPEPCPARGRRAGPSPSAGDGRWRYWPTSLLLPSQHEEYPMRDSAHASSVEAAECGYKAMGRLGYAIRARKFRSASKDIGLLWSAACAPRDVVVTQSNGVAGKESRTE